MANDPTFWLNRRVLVTGHTGFVGSWIASWLSAVGADLTGFARRPATPLSLFTLAGLDGRLVNVTGDIRDRARVEQTVAAMAPEIIVHLAGRHHGPGALKRPLDSFDTNATGTLNLLHAARGSLDLRAIIVLSPGRPDQPPGSAADPLNASVACAGIIVETFRRCYLQAVDGVGIATLRLPELVGGGDYAPGRLVPDLVRAIGAGRVPALEAAARAQPLLHVLDALACCDALARALVRRPDRFAGSWTAPAAPPGGWTRAAVAGHVAGRLGGRWAPAASSQPAMPGIGLAPLGLRASLAPDGGTDGAAPAAAAALATALGWRPRLAVEAALDWTLDGYRRFETEADGGFITDQLERHRDLPMPALGPDPASPQPFMSPPMPPTKASHVPLPA